MDPNALVQCEQTLSALVQCEWTLTFTLVHFSACDPGCRTCMTDATTCTGCFDGWYDDGSNGCVSKCHSRVFPKWRRNFTTFNEVPEFPAPVSVIVEFSLYKARHAHKRLYTVLPKYRKIQVLPGITSCRLMKTINKQLN